MSDPDRGPTRATTLPSDPKERKKYPIFSGVLAYFPDAIAAVAHVSWLGNEQHNPGEPLHWARGKSMDQEDTLVRHLMESAGPGTAPTSGYDSDGVRHSAKAAWRALAKLQLEIEAEREAMSALASSAAQVPIPSSESSIIFRFRCNAESPYPAPKWLYCSLKRGHSGEHRAHDSHDLNRDYESWTEGTR